LAALATLSALAAWAFHAGGFTLSYGDAEAHLNIARRIVDSWTPGYEQIGTVWLPLLHVLLIPFARITSWWQSGLAGIAVPAASFVLAGMFLFWTARQSFGEEAAGVTAALCFALNPNLLYLQSTPMTEPLFFACQLGLTAAVAWFANTQRTIAIFVAGLAALAGTLVRYDGWFLLPFAALAILAAARENRWLSAAVFSLLAALGPLYWLVHNRWIYSNWLEFYNGPYSAKAIQGAVSYAGQGDWLAAGRYFLAAAKECAGWGLLGLAVAGLAGVAVKRAWAPLLILAAGPLFYVASLHSGGTPIQVPGLWPDGCYNTRYGMAILPLAAFSAAGLVALLPRRAMIAAVVAIALAPWILYPRMSNWIVWKEAQVNSQARRSWTRDTAEFLRQEYRRGDGIYLSFGDQIGIVREAGIPLRETFHEGNGLTWIAALTRPDLFWWQKWAIAREGDQVSRAMKAKKARLVRIIRVSGAPSIEVYENAHPLRQGARRTQ
jgi:hypothetical protein